MATYHDIVLTDIQLHVATRRKPLSFIRSILKAIRSGKKQGRYYQNGILPMGKEKGTADFTIPLPPEIQEEWIAAEKAGEIVRIITPKGGFPVYFGKDTIEFIEARRRRGIPT